MRHYQIFFKIITLIAFSFGATAQSYINIPDANFKAYLVGNTAINTNNDSEIEYTEALAFTGTIDCRNRGISTLQGIEVFKHITGLDFSDNSLTWVNLSLNTALTNLKCSNNSLYSLDISNSTNLNILHCDNNLLSSLNVQQNTALSTLRCQNNSLALLLINTGLTTLDCSNNSLNNSNSVNFNPGPSLVYLNCSYNPLNNLNSPYCTNLNFLICNDASLNNIDTTQNTALKYLFCNDNSLSSLYLTQNTNLTKLNCSYNSINTLNLSQNTDLIELNCDNNSLYSLDVSNGNNTNFTLFLARNNTNLTCIQVDVVAFSTANWAGGTDSGTVFSLNCGSAEINEQVINNILTIYPNPTNSLINIDIQAQIESITILDVMGKTVKYVISNKNTFDVSDLEKGIYMLQLKTNKGLLNRKFIKG